MGQRRIGGRSVDPNVYGNDLVDRLSTMADYRKSRTANISPILTGMQSAVPIGDEDTISEGGGEYEYGAPKMGTAEYDEYTKDNPSPPVFDYLANYFLGPAMTIGAKYGANAALPVVGPPLVDAAKEVYNVVTGNKTTGKALGDFTKNTILGYTTGQATKGIDFGKNPFFSTVGRGIANFVGKSVLGKAWGKFMGLFGDEEDESETNLPDLGPEFYEPENMNTYDYPDPLDTSSPPDTWDYDTGGGGGTETDTFSDLWEGDTESGMYGGAYDYGDTGWEGDSESGMYGGAYD
jgi:hypothetical protein